MYNTKKSPPKPQSNKQKRYKPWKKQIFKQSLPNKQTFFFFLRADAKCLFSLFWIEVSEHMLCFNKSWRNHNRETQTLMNNSVLEFGDTHQNSLCSSLSFSALENKNLSVICRIPFPSSYRRTQPGQADDLHNI